MDHNQAFAAKLYHALKLAGVTVYELRVNAGQGGAFVVQAVLANTSRGTLVIEDAQIQKKDYRIAAVDETKERQTAK
jgi:hypothetical protein